MLLGLSRFWTYKVDTTPNRYEELICKWEECTYPKLDKRGKRLLLFTPEVFPWDILEVELEYTMRMPLDDVIEIDWKKPIDLISYDVR